MTSRSKEERNDIRRGRKENGRIAYEGRRDEGERGRERGRRRRRTHEEPT